MTAQHIQLGEPHENEKKPIRFLIDNLPSDYVVINNGRFDHGSNEIDVVVLAPHGIYVIELKNYDCQITGNQDFWYLPDGQKIESPIRVCRRKTQQIKAALNRFRDRYKDLFCQTVVFITGESYNASYLAGVNDSAKKKWVWGYKDIIEYLTSPQKLDAKSRIKSLVIFFPELIDGFSSDFEIPIPERINQYSIRSVLWVTDEYTAVLATTQEYPHNFILRIYDLTSKKLSQEGINNYRERFNKDFASIQRINTPGKHSSDGHEIILTSFQPFYLKMYVKGIEKSFFVCPMQYVEGELFINRLSTKSILQWVRYSIAAQLCRGIDFIHRAGVAHRNLLPENILITRDNQVQIFNFDHGKIIEGGRTMYANLLAYPNHNEISLMDRFYKPDTEFSFNTSSGSSIEPFDQARCYDIYALGGILLNLFLDNYDKNGLPGEQILDPKINSEIRQFITDCRSSDPNDLLKLDLSHMVSVFCEEMDRENGGVLPRLNDGDTILEHYDVVRELKTTNISRTYLCQHQITKDQAVIKYLDVPNNMATAEIEAFKDISRQIDAQYTASFIDCGIARVRQGKILPPSSRDGHGIFYIIQEYIQGPTLKDYILNPDFELETQLELARGIIAAVAAIHKIDYTHRDIKPSNFIVSLLGNDGGHRIKIIDFGLSRKVNQEAKLEGGTQGYIPPEVRSGSTWGFAGDVWAIAHTILAIFCGENKDELNGPKVNWDIIHNLHWEELENFLRRNCDENPSNRDKNAVDMLQAFDLILSKQNNQADADSVTKSDIVSESDRTPEIPETTPNDPASESNQPSEFDPNPQPPQIVPPNMNKNTVLNALDSIEKIIDQQVATWNYESFDAEILGLLRWIDAKMKIDSTEGKIIPQEFEKRNKVRAQLAKIVTKEFESALQSIESSSDQSTFQISQEQARHWFGVFETVGLAIPEASHRLERAISRFELFIKATEIFEILINRLNGDNIQEHGRELRPEIERTLSELNRVINDLKSRQQSPFPNNENDPRILTLERLVQEINDNAKVKKIFTDLSLELSIQQSEAFDAQMTLLKQKLEAKEETTEYFLSPDLENQTRGRMLISEAIEICDQRWKNFAQNKIKAYALQLLNEGLTSSGPFKQDPLYYEQRLSELEKRVHRPINDLDQATQREYASIRKLINQAIQSFTSYRRLLDSIDVNQSDALGALMNLIEVWRNIEEYVPVLETEYIDRRRTLVTARIPAQLKSMIVELKQRFTKDPTMVEEDIQNLLERLKPYNEFQSEQNELNTLLGLCHLYEQEIKRIRQAPPVMALKRLNDLRDRFKINGLNVDDLLEPIIAKNEAAAQPTEVAQKLIERAQQLIERIKPSLSQSNFDINIVQDVNRLIDTIAHSLPELEKQRDNIDIVEDIYGELKRLSRRLWIIKNYINAKYEISRAGADLTKIEGLIDEINQWQAGETDPIVTQVMLQPILTNKAQFAKNDRLVKSTISSVAQLLDNPSSDPIADLGKLLRLWSQVVERQKLSTSLTQNMKDAWVQLRERIITLCNVLLDRLSTGFGDCTSLLLKQVVSWCESNQISEVNWKALEFKQIELTAREYLFPVSGFKNLRELADAVTNAYTTWSRAVEKGHPLGEPNRLALLKLKALVDAENENYKALNQALVDTELKHDLDIIIRNARVLIDEAVELYENISYLSGKHVIAGTRQDEAAITFPKLVDLKTDFENIIKQASDIDNTSVSTASKSYLEVWQENQYGKLLSDFGLDLDLTPLEIKDEINFRKEIYSSLAGLLSKLKPDSRLKELHNVCTRLAPAIFEISERDGIQRKNLFVRFRELRELPKKIWKDKCLEVITQLEVGK